MSCKLHFAIQSYWHPGTGRGAGSDLDAVTHRDSSGLPVLPGRSVKGLLRDAVAHAAALGWYGGADPSHALFGWRPLKEGDKRPEGTVAAGSVRTSDATLPGDLAEYLAGSEKARELIPGLFRSHFGTAVDARSGTALEKSLRGMEVIVPLQLRADIAPISGHPVPDDWRDLVRTALPLLRCLGAHRNRGLGRVRVSLEAYP